MRSFTSSSNAVAAGIAMVAATLFLATTSPVNAFTPIVLTPLDHTTVASTTHHNHRQFQQKPILGMANYMNYNDYYYCNGNGNDNNYYNGNGNRNRNANNDNLFYGATSYNQRNNDGYSGGVNLSNNGRSQQDNLRGRGSSESDRRGGVDGYMYDDYERNRFSGYGGVNGGGDYYYRDGPRPESSRSMQMSGIQRDRSRQHQSDRYNYDDYYGGSSRQYNNGDRSGGLMRYRPSEYYDSSSSLYNLEGKRVRRFDPHYDQPDRFYDQGALYDRERAMAEGRRGREYASLRRYDPYYDGPNGLYDEAALYEGKAAGMRQYSFDPYYDEDRFSWGSSSSSTYGGNGVRRPMTTPYGSGGSALALTGGRRRGGRGEGDPNVLGSSMYDRRPMHEKYYPSSNEREERNRTRPGAMQSRRRPYDDDGWNKNSNYGNRRYYSNSNYYNDDDDEYDNGYGAGYGYGGGYSNRVPFIKNMEDDSMESFREGRGVRKSNMYYNDNYDSPSSSASYVSGVGRGGAVGGKSITSNDDRYNYVSRARTGGAAAVGNYNNEYSGGSGPSRREYEYDYGGGRRGGTTVNGSYYPPPTNPRGPANGGMSIDDLKEML